MDVIKWLETLLGDCRLVGSAEEALALVPSLALDAPYTVDVPLDGGASWRGCPVGFAKTLRQPLGMMVAEAMTEVIGGQGPSDPSGLSLEELAGDAATAALARLLIEAWRSGPRSASLVMLEAVRQASQIAWGDFDELTRYSPASAARARRALEDRPDRLNVRVEYLHGLAWALSVRLGGAWALAAAIDPSVNQTRLYQALVANRLVLVAPQGALSPGADLEIVAGVLGIQVEEGILTATHQAVSAVLKLALDGGGDAAGAGLRAIAGSRSDPATLALDPRLSGMALHVLPDLLDAKALKAAGVSKSAQKRLLKRDGASATGALYAQATSALATWDVLSSLAGRCLPIEQEGGAWTSRLGRVSGQLPWPLLTPRGDGGLVDLTVVGVGLDGLWETVRALAQDQGEPLVLSAAQGIWRGLVDRASEHRGLAASLGANGLGFFPDGKSAEAWAEDVRSAFRPPLRLDLAPLAQPLVVPTGGDVALNIARGRCAAAWDGHSLWAAGAAVSAALPSGGAGLTSASDDDGLQGLAAMAADTGADPFGGDPPPMAADTPDPDPGLPDEDDPFAVSVSPDAPEPSLQDVDDAFDVFGADEPIGGPPEITFDEDVPEEDGDDDAFYLAPPPDGEAAPEAEAADPDLFMLPPPTAEELADHDEPVEAPFMLPPPTADELKGHEDSQSAAGGGGYEIEDEDDSAVSTPDEDPLGAFDAPAEESVEPDDSDADFEAMGASAGFRYDDGQGAASKNAEETFKFESPVFEDGAGDNDNGGGFSLTEGREDATGGDKDIWASARTEEVEAEAAGDDLIVEDSDVDDSDAPATPAALGLGMADLRYLFDGYVHYLDGQASMVFGRRYGDRVLDRHVYEFQGDKDKVYRQFLLDKVEEGFVPRTDLVGDLPTGIDPEGIDLERMGAVAGGG